MTHNRDLGTGLSKKELRGETVPQTMRWNKKAVIMKAFYRTMMLVAAAAMTFVSCQKEIENPEIDNAPKMKTIKVSTSIATRTTLDSNHENIVWSSGDNVSLFNDADNTTNTKLTYAAGGDITVEVPSATTEIYMHYPYYSGNADKTKASIYIASSQTQANPGELAGYYFPMVAKGTVGEDNKAIVSFYPVAGALALNIYNSNLSGTEKVRSVTVTPSGNTHFVGSQTTDLTGDDIKYTETSGDYTSVTVTLTNPLSLSNTAPSDKQTFDGQIYVCLAKQSYASVKFTIVTDKGSYEITSSSTAPFDLVSNDFIPVNINLNKATFTEFSIADGDYVILSYDSQDSKYYAMDTDPNETSQRRDLTEFSYSGGDNTTTDDPTLVWTITKSNSSYSISGAGMYLSSGSNTAPMSSTAVSFTVLSGTTDGTAVVVSGERFLKRNEEYGFGFYSTSEDLFFIPVTYTGNPVLNVDTTPITISASDTETKTVEVSGYLYDSISAGAFEDSEGNAASDWLEVSYADGTVTYNATEPNTSTTKVKEAYIVVTATKGTVSTIKAIKVTQACVPPSASDGDKLWVEDFSGYSVNDVPEASTGSTIVYGSGSLNYTCVNGGSETKVYSAALAGGSAPELLVGKSGGSFSVQGVPTGSATVMTLSYAANNASLSVTSSTTGITLTKITDYVYQIEAQSGLTSFDLVFTNSSSGNTRLDDVSVVAGAPVASISVSTNEATNTETTTGTTATLNGSITLVNGASLDDISEAGFYYKTSESTEYTKVTSTVATSFSSDLTGLSTSSDYVYYAYAKYNDTEVKGSDVTFSTTVSDKVVQDPITFDLSTASYSSASTQSVVWSNSDATLTLAKSSSSTNANNYLGGDSNDHTRLYKDQVLTIAPASGCEITSIVITTTGTSYSTNFVSSSWSNTSSVTSSSSVVTIIPTDGSSSVGCTISAATRAKTIVINYKK